jgi:hypothetical protein
VDFKVLGRTGLYECGKASTFRKAPFARAGRRGMGRHGGTLSAALLLLCAVRSDGGGIWSPCLGV